MVGAIMKSTAEAPLNSGLILHSLGRTLGIVPRQLAPSGYMDFEVDDFKDGTPLHQLQTAASSLVYGDFGNSSAT